MGATSHLDPSVAARPMPVGILMRDQRPERGRNGGGADDGDGVGGDGEGENLGM